MEISEDIKKILEDNPIYLATSADDKPNVTLTQSCVVLSPKKVLICDCEMKTAKDNILKNPNCTFVVYDDKDEVGYKAIGKVKYFTEGEYMRLASDRLSNEPYSPKGVLEIEVDKLFEIK